MLGLRIYDDNNRELAFHTNQLTKDLIKELKEDKELLDEINTQKSFIIWIRLPEEEKIKSYQTKIIKLIYKNKTPVRDYQKSSIKKLKQLRFFFSLPTFPIIYVKPKGIEFDVFYIIEVPYEYEIDFEILEKHKVKEDGSLQELDKVYIDGHENVISVRIPSTVEPVRFKMIYDVVPKRNEKIFYSSLLISLVTLSVLFLLLNTKIIDSESINLAGVLPLNQIYNNLNPLLGGVVTISAVIVGFMRSYSTDKTRFWFLIPIMISAVAFLSKIE